MFPDLPHADLWLPMLAAILTGAAIGLDRELTVRSAGLRTHTLVCFSSALLMMAATQQTEWIFQPLPGASVVSDPIRMAHGILTGIGFLGAGVIFRQGASVRGLTTAASVWMTAALGVLYGAGLMWLAVAGTVTTLVVLVIFRLFHMLLPDRIEVKVDMDCEADVDTGAILQVLRQNAADVSPGVWTRDLGAGGGARLAARMWLRNPLAMQALDQALRDLPGLRRVVIAPVGAEDDG